MNNVNVLIMDLSKTFCKQMAIVLGDYSNIQIVATVHSIEEGKKVLFTTEVDVILLDVKIGNNSRKTVEMLLENKAIPIIMLADHSVEQTARTVQAMVAGAVDFIKFRTKTLGEIKENETQLINKIMMAKRGKSVDSFPQKKKKKREQTVSKTTIRKCALRFPKALVAIGASTGGPRALQQIIKQLPEDICVPLLIVQHMPSGFTKSLANRLNEISKIHVKEAEHGEKIENGTAYIAPGDRHMEVVQRGSNFHIDINKAEARLGHRPSVNTLFESVAKVKDTHTIAVILTGMGKDGSAGIKQIKQVQKEAIVLVESEETAIINGMPNAAIETNEVTEVLRVEDIAQAIIDYVSR